MNVVHTSIPGLLILEPKVFADERGFSFESINQKLFQAAIGRDVQFVQDNHSRSVKYVLPGMHYQIGRPEGKLVGVATGEVVDVAVDIRRNSPTFGCWVGVNLSADNKRQVGIPKDFAHEFLAVSEFADFLYKTTDYWTPELERSTVWDDPPIMIMWPLDGEPYIAARDRAASSPAAAECFP